MSKTTELTGNVILLKANTKYRINNSHFYFIFYILIKKRF